MTKEEKEYINSLIERAIKTKNYPSFDFTTIILLNEIVKQLEKKK